MQDDDKFDIFEDNIVYSPWISFDSADWRVLEPYAKLEFYKKNIVLYNSNEFSNYVYVVKTGRVELYIVNSEGYKKVIGICDKGSMCGELSLFDNRPNFCIARVCSDAQLYKIPNSVFLEAVYSNSLLLKTIMRSLVSKIRVLYTQIEYLAFRPSTAKVALMLMSMCKDYGIKINGEYKLNITFTHNDIANMTGLSRVSVSNTLLDFTSMGIIRKEGNEYFIKDMNMLRSMVE